MNIISGPTGALNGATVRHLLACVPADRIAGDAAKGAVHLGNQGNADA